MLVIGFAVLPLAAHSSEPRAGVVVGGIAKLNLDKIRYPGGKPPSAQEVELGKKLFFDKRLSFNDSTSCATCHEPDKGLGDAQRFSSGAAGKPLSASTRVILAPETGCPVALKNTRLSGSTAAVAAAAIPGLNCRTHDIIDDARRKIIADGSTRSAPSDRDRRRPPSRGRGRRGGATR